MVKKTFRIPKEVDEKFATISKQKGLSQNSHFISIVNKLK